MKTTWVQDAKETEVSSLISRMTARNIATSPPGSKYVVGPSKSGKYGEKGIYFQDPTAKDD